MDVTEHFVPHESETPALSVRKGLLGLLVAKPSAIEFAYSVQRQAAFVRVSGVSLVAAFTAVLV